MKYMFLLIITVLAMIGCSPKQLPVWAPGSVRAPSILMHGDPAFTEKERYIIDSAAEMWRIQTSGLADIQVVYDYDEIKHSKEARIRKIQSDSLEAFEQDCYSNPICAPIVLAWVSPSGGLHNPWHEPVDMVFMPERSNGQEMAMQVIVHEFGHVLGMPHSNCVQALLYPVVIEDRKHACLRQPDLSLFCTVNNCSGYQMKPCEG